MTESAQSPELLHGDPDHSDISQHEIEEIEARSSPRTPVIYEVICRLGEEEMARPVASLMWSGIAAGLSVSFSVLAEALLQANLPDDVWRSLLSPLGYCVGFLMVVLSRQQLFTENTITAVLPVMASPTFENLGRLARLWGVVLGTNLVGTLIAALFCALNPALSSDLYAGMISVSHHLTEHNWASMFFGGITSGFLMAAMVWMLPSADTAQFWVIVLMTYLIALGGFPHIVVGGNEAFLLLVNGDVSPGWVIGDFGAPVLAGNIVGGTVLFALISYAQVMQEL